MNPARRERAMVIVEHPELAGVTAILNCWESAKLGLVAARSDSVDNFGRKQPLILAYAR